MTIAIEETMKADTPEARRYNRIRRWLSVADFLLGMAVLVALLASGWTAGLRDLAYRLGAQNYTLAVFVYVFLLMSGAKLLGLPLDIYSYRLEHRFHLSNQKL